MSLNIYTKRLGINFSYLIKGAGCIMVDTGPPFSVSEIIKWMRSIPIMPEELKLIILTHGHFDHVGAATELKRITGAKIAIHQDDQDMFENGELVLPTPVTTWGRVTRKMMKPVMSIFQFDGSPVDLVITNNGLSLQEYGIPGEIVHTPGHTPGSISVILDNGDAFVGCMTHNAPPFRLKPALPIFADDITKMRESWKLLDQRGAKMIYPGHGNPFPVGRILKSLG